MNATKMNQLANLIAQKRVVFVDFCQSQSLKITARVDMPEWGVMAGETVYLVASDSYAGYYYIQRYDAARGAWVCYCPARKPCKHEKYVQVQRLAEYRRQREIAESEQVAREVLGCGVAEDLTAHVEDALAVGEFELQAERILQQERRASAPLNAGRGFTVVESEFGSIPMAS